MRTLYIWGYPDGTLCWKCVHIYPSLDQRHTVELSHGRHIRADGTVEMEDGGIVKFVEVEELTQEEQG